MTDTLEWFDPDGSSTIFDIDGDGVTGRLAPPNERVEDTPPGAGARLRSVRHTAREVALVQWVSGADEASTRAALRALVASLDPLRGDGVLRSTTSIGEQRELTCRYVSGFESQPERLDEGGLLYQRAVLVFRAAEEPYWVDAADTAMSFELGDSTVGSFFPVPPLRLASSELFAQATVDNGGDVEAWPVWTLSGPGSGLAINNLTTGKSLALSTSVTADETITVDTRPGRKTVTLGDGTNLFPDLTSRQLWPLDRGPNSIEVQLSGATSDSVLQLSYRQRYLAP